MFGVRALADVVLIPRGVVQNQQRFGRCAQPFEHGSNPCLATAHRELVHYAGHLFRCIQGQVVHPEMKEGPAKRDRPFDLDGASAHFIQSVQIDAGMNVVVIGNGYQSVHSERVFDLRFFEIPRLLC